MPVLIAMLRGVNVGGHNQIKMEALRELFLSLKFMSPQTYVQSGNVVFQSSEPDLEKVAKRIQQGIEKKFGCCPQIVLRTADDLRAAVAKNPLAKRRGIDPAKL